MWWINSICQLVSTFVLVSMVFCYARLRVNIELLKLGLEPKYDPKKLSLWCKTNLIIAFITFVVVIVNAIVWLC